MVLSLLSWKIIYISAAFLLFAYSMYSLENWRRGIYIAIAINIIPFVFLHRISMDSARLLGVPLSYIPMLVIVCSGVRFSKFRMLHMDYSFAILGLVLLVYVTSIGLLLPAINFVSGISYVIGIAVNLFLFVTVRYLLINKDSYDNVIDILRGIYFVIFAGVMVGILRYLFGIDDSANFMPANNRNCTVLFVIVGNAIGYYLVKHSAISVWNYVLFVVFSSVMLYFVGSRSGLIGFVVVMLGIYLLCADLKFWKKLLMLGIFCIIFANVLIAFKDTVVISRMHRAFNTIVALKDGKSIGHYQREVDSIRYTLLRGGVATIKDNVWFGTGLGITNYRNAFRKSFPGYNHYVNSHNFYITYCAQLGVIGFFLLMFILYMVYKKLPIAPQARVFRVLYFSMMVMMVMNEYIFLPYLWMFFALFSCCTTGKQDKLKGVLSS